MADRALLHLISYDIADNKRRRRIAERLEERAARVQESLFELRITTRAARALMAELVALSGSGDSIRVYAVPDAALSRCKVHGGPEIAGGGRFWLM